MDTVVASIVVVGAVAGVVVVVVAMHEVMRRLGCFQLHCCMINYYAIIRIWNIFQMV